MLIICLCAIMALVSVIVFRKTSSDLIEGFSIAFCVVACISTLVCICMCVSVKINEDIEYQNAYYHKATLEYRLENIEKNNVGNEYLYNDIVEFNKSLRTTKKWANSPWTNWFNNQRIAELDYIELPVS